MNYLVKIEGKEPMTSTLIIADGMKLEHRAVMVLVNKYKERLETRGVMTFEMSKPTKGENNGRPVKYALVNESQFLFLVTLMRNSEVVLDFKDKLTKEFIKQRKLIAHLLTQRQNQAWIEQREIGKLNRAEETDTIKEFVDYCVAQGSTSAKMYYSNISKMENAALFMLEQRFPNVRDVLSGQQLQIIASADIAVAKALQYGMEQKMPYKEIFQMAKDRIIQFSEIVGKSPVPIQGALVRKSAELLNT